MSKFSNLQDVQKSTGIPLDYLSANAVEISAVEHKQLETSYIHLFEKMQDFFLEKDKHLNKSELDFLKTYPSLSEKLSFKEHLIGRPDGVIIDGKVQYFELNITPSIGGFSAFSAIQNYFSFKTKQDLECPLLALSNYVKSLGRCAIYRKKGIVERIDEEDAEVVDLINSLGANAVFLDLKDVKNHLAEMDSVLRFHSYGDAESELISEIQSLEDEASSQGLCTPLALNKSSYLYSKVFMALYSEYADVGEDIVYSRWLGNRETQSIQKFKKRFLDALENKEQFLIKRDYSNRGRHVHFGDEVTSVEWRELLEKALIEGDWIVQRIVISNEYPFEINKEIKSHPFIISPYFFGEYYGGTVVRIMMDKNNKTCVMPVTSPTGVTSLIRRTK